MIMRIWEKTRYFVQERWTEHLLTQWITSIMIVAHWGFGIAIIVGGPSRFTQPTYTPLLESVHGEVWLWGLWTIVAALLMMTPFRWPNIAGLWLGMSWMGTWCYLFASALRYPTAGATAMVAYGVFALIDAALLTARVLEKPGE